jgi:hypothetical protein
MCVLGLACACFIIECNIQRTTYGRVDLGVTYTMEDGVPAVRVDGKAVAVPTALERTAEVFTPPPVKLLAALWRWETEMAEQVWGWMS